jgi:hypothetical protein
MMETLSSSETSVLTRTTRRNISEDAILHSHRRENLKSYIAEELMSVTDAAIPAVERQTRASGERMPSSRSHVLVFVRKSFRTREFRVLKTSQSKEMNFVTKACMSEISYCGSSLRDDCLHWCLCVPLSSNYTTQAQRRPPPNRKMRGDVLNNPLWTDDKGWSSCLGVEWRLNRILGAKLKWAVHFERKQNDHFGTKTRGTAIIR